MIQHFTSLLRLNIFFQKSYCPGSIGLTAIALWLTGLFAAPSPLSASPKNASLPGDSLITATICANETYFFNGESLNTPGEYLATFTASDGTDSVVTLQLSVLPVAAGNVAADICQGETYNFNGVLLTQSGMYVDTLLAENGCDSIVTLTLTVLPNPLTNLNAAICAGSFYIFQGDTLTESGNYSIVLPAHNGCDSIVRLQLDVVAYFEVSIAATICHGDFYIFAGDTLYTDGVYVDSLTATGGCDSTVTLTLKVLPVSSTQLTAAICEGSEYVFQGDTLTLSGSYADTLQAANGCDSLVTLTLTVVPFFEINLEASVCEGETYIFGNDTLDVTGVYVDSLTAAVGCDSIVTLTLTVLPIQSSALEATICQGDTLEYNGELLTEAGVYEFVLTGENGCDSIVTLTLNVLPLANTALEATICQGETYNFNGEILTEAGVYDAVFDAENGCDSIVTLTLIVLPTQQTAINASICEGELYEYNGDTLTESGAYPYVFTAENGCDSTVTVVLTVNQPQNVEVNVSICEGESYEFNGDTLTQAGNYTATFTGANGCDYTVMLILDILPVQNTTAEATICNGSVYEFNGDNLTTEGVYTAILSGENGCDSTVVLTLTVLPTQNTSLDAAICAGEFYEFSGDTLTEAGAYDFVFAGENGCDSTVTVHLTVLPVQTTGIEASICEGNSYEYNGEILTESGSYEFVFDGSNGCDSIVTLKLDVLPSPFFILSVTLCEGTTYEFDGIVLTESGTYIASYPAANGCDSTVTLQLAFVQFFETNLQASICNGESYEFGSDTLTESGDYSLTLTAAGGCDSIINLVLTVLPLSESTTNANICAGESYEFNGDTLTVSGVYTAVLIGSNGCDSTAVLNLTVLPVQNTSLSATICANESYDFNGEILTESGTYTAELSGENGCDSTVVLNLTVVQLQSSSFDAVICQGESYIFDGQILTDAGVYESIFDGSNGCDSIVTLTLSVLPLAEGAFAAINCNGNSYEYNGAILTESGVYEFTFPGEAANGCDSVVTLYLTIFPLIPPTETSATICAGETYDFYGSPLTVSGTYSIDLASANGCDSTIVLELTVLPHASSIVNASVCKGEGYEFNGETIFVSGTYTDTLQAANGCDSVAVLHLTVIVVNDAIELQNGTLTAQANNATFQWLNCDTNQPVPGATGNTYTPTLTGNYAAIVTQNGCTDTSACMLVQVVSVIEILPGSAWAIQPNPARYTTALVFKDALQEELRLEIYDAAGRLLHSQNMISGSIRMELDLNGLPDGLLLMRLVNERGTSTKRFIKAGN